MKDEFDFPRFEDLQLGPYGDIQGCGCLMAKFAELQSNAELTVGESINLEVELAKQLGSNYYVYSRTCPNTLSNRRKAYNALVRATKKALNVTIGP